MENKKTIIKIEGVIEKINLEEITDYEYHIFIDKIHCVLKNIGFRFIRGINITEDN